MNSVRKLFSVLLIAMMAIMGTGCSSWISNFKKDPVAQVQSVVSALETVVTIASIIFSEVKPLLPEAKRADVQQRFSHAVLAVEASKRALRDALTLAESTDTKPDLILALQSALKTADGLRAFVRELQAMVQQSATANAVARAPTAPDDLDAAVDSLRRYQH